MSNLFSILGLDLKKVVVEAMSGSPTRLQSRGRTVVLVNKLVISHDFEGIEIKIPLLFCCC